MISRPTFKVKCISAQAAEKLFWLHAAYGAYFTEFNGPALGTHFRKTGTRTGVVSKYYGYYLILSLAIEERKSDVLRFH